MKITLLLFCISVLPLSAVASEETVEDWDKFLEQIKELKETDPAKHQEAIEKISRLSNAGVREAQFLLGVFLINYSREMAFDLLSTASQKGCSGATGLLALADLDANKFDEGIKKLRRAATGGDAAAQFVLGKQLENLDSVESYSWYFQIIEQYKGTYLEPNSQIGVLNLSKRLSVDEIEQAKEMAIARMGNVPEKYFCQQSSPVPLKPVKIDN